MRGSTRTGLRLFPVIERIEATLDFDDCDADFLNDDFSWVHDFDSSIEVGDLY
jgi:hypothetical protein